MPNTLQFGLVCVFAAAYFFVSRQAPEPSIAAQCMEWYTATMANFGSWTAGWQLYAAVGYFAFLLRSTDPLHCAVLAADRSAVRGAHHLLGCLVLPQYVLL